MRCGFCQPAGKYDSSLRNGRRPFRNDKLHQTTGWKNLPTCVAPASLPLIAAGKSFGGRMTSQAQEEAPLPDVRGLASLGFPLHPRKEAVR